MTPADIAILTKVMGPVLREYTANAVAEATAPLLAKHAALEQRIRELETAPPVVGPAGPMGAKGEAGTGVASLLVSADGRLMAHFTDGRSQDAGPLPRGEKGAQGEAAPPPDMEAIVTRVLSLVPPPAKGEPGQIGPVGPSGAPGAKGDPGRDGINGKDAELPDVAEMVASAVAAAMPTPINGRDGKDGIDGKSVDPAAVEALVVMQVEKAISRVPPPRDGKDGKDGRDIDPGSLELVISAHVAKAIDAIPVPKDGRNGRDGQDGAPGVDGRSLAVEDVAPLITREIEQRIAAIPVAKDGTGFTGAVINRDGHLVLTLSNGETRDIGHVVGKDGAPGIDGKDAVGTPGKDGLDGLGFDDFDLVLDDTRGWIFRLAQGERVKEWELGLPFDANVWKVGSVYPKGAGVTWDGHYWIAVTKTSEQPGEANPSWRLAVRRGKQGREGQKGKDGPPGKDLTSFDPATGRKW